MKGHTMTGLYIGSTIPQAGKTLLTFSLGLLLQKAGHTVGYMKPLGKNPQRVEGIVGDSDALVAQEVLGQNVAPDMLSPVMMPQNLHALPLLRPMAEQNGLEAIAAAYATISQGKTVTLVSGTESFPGTGHFCGADGLRLVQRLGLQVLLVERYRDNAWYDAMCFWQQELGQSLLGVVLNDVPEEHLRDVHNLLVPYLSQNGVQVHGVLPRCPALMSMRVADLAQGLSGYIVAANNAAARMVEGFIIGTMQVENFMLYVKRNPARVVIVGGDRADLQLVALSAGSPCIVLTGNLTPSELVRQKAESMGTPLVVVKEDTYTVARTMAHILKCKKLRDLHHIQQAAALVEEHLNTATLFRALGIPLAEAYE